MKLLLTTIIYLFGIYVKSIESLSPAANAGIKAGDIITLVDGTNISKMSELNSIKNSKNIGDTIAIQLYRNKEIINVNLILGEQN